ncbi:hypothetical protein F441_08899, partial [Phytophthora nicotianae CJ01A1]
MMFSKTICALCVAAVAFSASTVDASAEVAQTYGRLHQNYGGYGKQNGYRNNDGYGKRSGYGGALVGTSGYGG